MLADGSTAKSDRFTLRELKVGELTLSNVTASIGSIKSTPLLGQSFLSKLGSWSIDNNRHVLRLTGARELTGAGSADVRARIMGRTDR
jgi:predicted aspartyl protease